METKLSGLNSTNYKNNMSMSNTCEASGVRFWGRQRRPGIGGKATAGTRRKSDIWTAGMKREGGGAIGGGRRGEVMACAGD